VARAIWTGVISFGLVTIPVRLVTAVREKDVHFHQFHQSDGGRIQYRRFCEKEDREVPYQEIARGYEVGSGQFVLITDEELDRIAPERTRRIELDRFIDPSEIDPIYYDATYYLAPDEQGERAYRLLQEAMSQSRKVAIGRFVLRAKEHLVAIRPLGEALALETLHYADEVIAPSDVEDIPRRMEVGSRELRMAHSLIESLEERFQPEVYRDEFRERVEALAQQKAKGQEVLLPEEPERPAAVMDLMEALRASVEEAKSRRDKRPARRAASSSQ
jgi:DNA end-binding protein Ku